MQKNEIIENINKQLTLQNKLNIITCGENWKNGVTHKGKIIDWITCFDMELSEFVDSFPWKHWKDIEATPDIINAQIELVDIWHFILSDLLRQRKHNIICFDIASFIEEKYANKETFNILSSQWVFNSAIKYLKHFINDPINNPYTEHPTLEYFFALCENIGLTIDKLFSLYFGKNILNEFRQNNGYNEGTYKKVWNKQEDNVVMYHIVANNTQISKEELLNALDEKYKELNNVA